MQALCGLQGIFDLFNCKTPAIDFNRSMLERAAVYRITVESFTGKERS